MKNITIGRRSFFLGAVAAAVSSALPATAAHASGGSSGPHVSFATQGHIGEVIVNPYSIAPLTAIIRNGGYELTEATVRIVPKPQGQEIKYKVSRSELLTHAGIPVFGLYPDYMNTVETTYTRKFHGKTEKFTDTYKIYAAPVYHEVSGSPGLHHNMFETKVTKVDAKFSDRLYLVNNLMQQYAKATRAVWNNPMGGAMEWNFYPQNAIIDTKGEVRWYMHVEPIYNVETIYHSGVMMGFQQDEDGNLTWGYGQRYVKYDLMGREIYNRRLPVGYSDFSHSLDNAQNGHSFIRVASSDPRRADGGVDHLPQDEPGNGDGGHQGVEVHRLGQGEEQQIVQGARHHRPALHGTQGPQGLLHHLAHGDLLPLAGEGHQADDHAQLIEGQQPGGEEQGQEDQCALQVQEGAQHIRVKGDPHRRHIGLVDLPQQRADDHQGHQLPQQFEFQHAPHGVSQLHTRHLTTQNPNTNHSTFWKVMQEARGTTTRCAP